VIRPRLAARSDGRRRPVDATCFNALALASRAVRSLAGRVTAGLEAGRGRLFNMGTRHTFVVCVGVRQA
jgi:hypothetical protein